MKKELKKEVKVDSVIEFINTINQYETFSFNALIHSTTLSSNDIKLELFKLIIEDKIFVIKDNRLANELNFKQSNHFNVKLQSSHVEKLIDCFFLFIYQNNQLKWNEFNKLTNHNFSDNKILHELTKQKLNYIEIYVFFKTMIAYFNGSQILFSSDLAIASEHITKLTHDFIANQSPLEKSKLVNINLDGDGVTLKFSLSKKSIAILCENECEDDKTTYFGEVQHYNTYSSEKIILNKEKQTIFDDLYLLGKEYCANTSLTILLHGVSGSGKTLFAYQLAKKMKASIYRVDFTKLVSKYIGETEKNISKMFKEFYNLQENTKKRYILLLNESDGLMNKRIENIRHSNDIFANQSQTQLLEELERFKGIMIATTNIVQNLDQAFYRRFIFKIHFETPTVELKKTILSQWKYKHLITNYHELLHSNWSIAQLKNIENKISMISKIRKIEKEDVDLFFKEEMIFNSKSNTPIGFNK